MKNISKYLVLLSLSVFSLMLLSGCDWFTKSQDQATREEAVEEAKPDILFMAKATTDTLQAILYDPETDTIVAEKNYQVKDNLSHTSEHTSWRANNSVQYLPEQEKIFFVTSGTSEMTGVCTNADGTCLNRFYEIGLNSPEAALFYETDKAIYHWVLNPQDNSLIYSFPDEDNKNYVIEKINLDTKKIQALASYDIDEYGLMTNMVVSEDGQHIYQAGQQHGGEEKGAEILYLYKLNLNSGDYDKKEVQVSDYFNFETSISPDNKYYAYFSKNTANLAVYDIEAESNLKIPFEGSIDNINLFWSGDSNKLLYFPENKLNYYNLDNSENVTIFGEPGWNRFVYIWAPNERYIVLDTGSRLINIYDMESDKFLDPTPKFFNDEEEQYDMVGASWVKK